MEATRQVIEIESYYMRLACLEGTLHGAWKLRRQLRQRQIGCPEQGQVGRLVNHDSRLRGAPVERPDARMGVLDVEYRIVLGRLHRLGEVEIHLRIGLACQHGEADDV